MAAASSSSSSSSSSMLITLSRCRWLRTHTQRPNQSTPFPFLPFNSSSSSSSSSSFPHTHTHTHRLFLPNAAAAPAGGGTPMEDSKFVPLNPDDPTFGPPALLLLGFQLDEVVKIHKFLKHLDGEFLEVIFCTEDMMTGSLWEAINTKQPNLEASKIAGSLPRICFLSGLTGEEMIMFIDAFPESGLAGAVFAAVVPNSADKPLQEVIEEIMGDHEMMKSRESS